jgi:superfamily I DNA/RNA helicase
MSISSERILERLGATNPPEDDDDDIGELEIAEYIVFLLALDTYVRYLEEQTGKEDMEDDFTRKAVQLVRMADRRHVETIQAFLSGNLTRPSHKKALDKAFRFLPTQTGLDRRTFHIKWIFDKSGPSIMRAVFKKNKSLQAVRVAMAAAEMDDADAALDKFAAIPLRNQRLRKWIDDAAKTAGAGTYQNATAVGAEEAVDDVKAIKNIRIQQEAAPLASDMSKDSLHEKDDLLLGVQLRAQEAAQKAMVVSGESDEPPVRSEVIGIATAAAIAAVTDPTNKNNISSSINDLDPEQRSAALTDGRVLVAAGAGSGKSFTLVSRIDYLVKDKGTNPARILACTFSTEAAEELKVKIAKRLGYDSMPTTGVQVGTMHSLFRKFVIGDEKTGEGAFGNSEEREMLKNRLIARKGKVNPSAASLAIRNIWLDCGSAALASHFGFSEKWVSTPPKAKTAGLYLNKWRGNDISLEEAKKTVKSKAQAQAVVWYEFYMGIKGDIPGWKPPCESKAYNKFRAKHRKGGERLGDLDDMLKIFLDILRRDEKAKKAIQGMFDHILVDECQDSNLVQHEILALMTEHIGDGSDGKSFWMVGDEVQAIYQFRGSRPELFTDFHEKAGWKTRSITTNYRCEPEIIEAANRLKSFNDVKVKMEAKPKPGKEPGKASIIVDAPDDNVMAALQTLDKISKNIAEGDRPENYAVLARTNAELNDFETACIINEIPYTRRGGRGFLDAPESKAVLGYLGLSSGGDYKKVKQYLISVLMKPNRGIFLSEENVEKAVDDAIDEISRRERLDINSVDPMMLLEGRYARVLPEKLKLPYRARYLANAETAAKKKGVYRKEDIARTADWMYRKDVDRLEDNLRDILPEVHNIQAFVKEEHTTEELLDYILDNVNSTVVGWDPETRKDVSTTTSLRDQISEDVSLFSGEEEEDEIEDEEEEEQPEITEEGLAIKKKEQERKGLGAIQFLFKLAEPNANDYANNNDPSTAQGFADKIARYSKLSDTLRIDLPKWKKEQQKIVDPTQRRVKPSAITLSTVHAVKGREWDSVTVLMPAGKFPLVHKPRPDEPPPDPEEMAEHIKAERNLAYVAITRAAVNLEILCPMQSGTAAGGVSPFVTETGLKMGENVLKPGASADVVKTASSDEEHDFLFDWRAE